MSFSVTLQGQFHLQMHSLPAEFKIDPFVITLLFSDDRTTFTVSQNGSPLPAVGIPGVNNVPTGSTAMLKWDVGPGTFDPNTGVMQLPITGGIDVTGHPTSGFRTVLKNTSVLHNPNDANSPPPYDVIYQGVEINGFYDPDTRADGGNTFAILGTGTFDHGGYFAGEAYLFTLNGDLLPAPLWGAAAPSMGSAPFDPGTTNAPTNVGQGGAKQIGSGPIKQKVKK